jgi:hypothetical protein
LIEPRFSGVSIAGVSMRLYSRLFTLLLLVLLAGCNTSTSQPTPTLQGPIVPTRIIPPTSEISVDIGTDVAVIATASAQAITDSTPIDSGNVEATLTAAGGTVGAFLTPTDGNRLPVTDTPSAVDTATDIPTNTVRPTVTESATPTITNTPTETLSPTPTDTATPTPTSNGQPTTLSYGDQVGGEITNAMPELLYTFEGQTGALVTISMTTTSGDLDTYLLLMAPNGEKVTENDDTSNTNRNSRIEGFRLSTDGTYTIIATRYQRAQGTSTGTFELTLETGAPDERPLLVLGEPVQGMIDGDNFGVMYRFDGEENQVIDINLNTESGDLNPMVILFAPDGHEYARNDDQSRRNSDALISGIRLPETGSYGVFVTRYQTQFGITTGDYEVWVDEADAADSPLTVLSRNIEYESTEEGSIGDDLPYYQIFTFAGRAGDVVTIELREANSDLDPLLILSDSQGHEILRNDDNLSDNDTIDSLIENATLPYDGFYTIIATRYEEAEGTSEGEFELELILEESADDNPTRLLYAVLNPYQSGGIRPDNTYYQTPFYAAGDDINDSNRDVEMQTLLTFVLPPLSPDQTIESAELDLRICREIGDGFGGFDDLTIYVDSYDELSSADGEPSSRADEVDTIGDCETVEITDAVRDAYDDDQSILQIRMAFDDVNRNGEPDYVWFDPRLIIILEN